MIDELQSCLFGSWSPTIGDPSIMGWITVFSYIAASILCATVLVRRSSNQYAFWIVLTVFLALLAVNKQLDLQSALTAIGRCTAKSQGWYDQRQIVQVIFIVVLGVVSLISTSFFAWSLRKGLSQIWPAFLGFSFLVTFVVMRAAGFHGFDRFIDFELGGVRMNWLFELTGIVMISLNAFLLIGRGQQVESRQKQMWE